MFHVLVFEPGAGGIPSIAIMREDLFGRYTSIDWTMTATYGYETCTVVLTATLDEGTDWLTNGFMRSMVVFSPDGAALWTGYLETVTMQAGQETRSRSIRDMANRVTVYYNLAPYGVPAATSATNDTTSQAKYGVKGYVETPGGQTNSTTATALRDRILAQRKEPITTPSSTVGTGDIGTVQLTLGFVGWYETLGWVQTSSSSTTVTSTTTQVGTLLTSIAATNAFISTSTVNIVSSGVTDTEQIVAGTSYREKIETLLSYGNSSSQRLAWGVYDTFVVAVWAGASPTTVHYQRALGSAELRDANGGEVYLWDVRPDKMYQVVDLLDVSPGATSDTVARYYIERITFHMDTSGMQLTLEPQASDSIDATIARISK